MSLVHVMQDWAPVRTQPKRDTEKHTIPKRSHPPLSMEIDIRMKRMIEYHRIKILMTQHQLSNSTGIPIDRLIAYETGDKFPDARDIDVLQAWFKTRLLL